MMKKIGNGTVPIVLGAVLILVAMGLCVFNIITDSRAGKLAEEVAAQLPTEQAELRENEIPDYKLNPKMNMPKMNIDGMDYIGVLFIDDLGLQLPVLSELSSRNLMKAPCRYKGTAYRKNMIIAGINYKSGFGGLNNLALGSVVRFIDTDGNEFFYTLETQENIGGKSIDQMEEGDWDLSLFTCNYRGNTRVTLRFKEVLIDSE